MRFVAALFGLLLAFGAEAAEPVYTPVHAIAMHGSPKYGPNFTHFDYVNPDAPKGGKVKRAAIAKTFDTLNNFVLKGNRAVGLSLIYDTLMVSSADEAFTEYGLVAKSMEMPVDRSWIIFNLRPEARFHDGEPITAEDVAFTLKILQSKGHPFVRFYYGAVESAEVLGPHKVKFTFKPGDNRELPLILGQMAVLPKHYWKDRDFEAATMDVPLGSGPYRIGKFESGRFINYERVADYWAKDLPVNRGQYNFDTIKYDYYRDATVALLALKAGEYDFREENTSKMWATAYETEDVAAGRMIKASLPHQNSAGMQGWVFNTRRDIFKDSRVREAIAQGFDFEWSNEQLFYGQYTRTDSYFSNSELGSKGLPTAEELAILKPYRGQVPDQVFTTEYQPPANKGRYGLRENLLKGLELLKDAGWVVKDRRLVNAETGAPFTFEILLISPAFERIALPFARNLRRLGMEVSVRTVDTAQYKNRLDSYDFDMIVWTWSQSLSPGNEQISYWTTEAAEAKGGRNFAGIKDPVVDELVAKLVAATDREALINTTRALDRVLLWGHYVVPNWHINYNRVAYWDKFGMPDDIPMQGYQFMAWWMKGEGS